MSMAEDNETQMVDGENDSKKNEDGAKGEEKKKRAGKKHRCTRGKLDEYNHPRANYMLITS